MSTRTDSSSAFLGSAMRKQGVTAACDTSGACTITIPRGVQATEPIVLHTAETLSVDVRVESGASVNIVAVIPPDMSASTVTQRALVGSRGAIHWQTVILGKAAQHSIVSTLHGDDARATADVVFYAHDKDRQSISVRNVFQAKQGGGQITIKGVAEHRAHVRCNGMIDIGLQGGGTDTFLKEEVLMLDPTARIDAVPGLGIKTNDVKASHSATVARLSAEDLFYFAARGIDEALARAMFVEGFLGDIVSRITDDKTRMRVEEMIRTKYASVKMA